MEVNEHMSEGGNQPEDGNIPGYRQVICASSKYKRQFYLDPAFEGLPQELKDELKILSVLFTEEVGGILIIYIAEDGSLQIMASPLEGDTEYNRDLSREALQKMIREKMPVLKQVEAYYRNIRFQI